MTSSNTDHQWFKDILSIDMPEENGEVTISGATFKMIAGILRDKSLVSDTQQQTSDTFGFKWKKRDTFESDIARKRMKEWLEERYGIASEYPWWGDYGDNPVVLDAGCGAGLSAMELFGDILGEIHYIASDISTAVDVAAERFKEQGHDAAFLQANLVDLPVPDESIDVIFSEGVLHHTDSTENALISLTKKLRVGGRFMFYVYKKKGPIREFTDDYIRDKLQSLTQEQGWDAMEPLSKLGKVLGDLDIEVEIPDEIDLLEIPAGKINLQRLFYWHVFKAFYRKDYTLDEMNHINYDWYAPANAHRQAPEEVRRWCAESDLFIEREVVEDAGITIIARKMEKQ